MDRPFGERLRRLREKAGLTQAELARGRLSESYISLLESGRRRPTDRTLSWLAERLGVAVEDLWRPPPASGLPEAELAIRRAEWEASSGEADLAVGRLESLLPRLRELEAPWLLGRARTALARALEATGRLDAALRQWEVLVEEGERDRRYGFRASAAVGVCRCARELGQLQYAASAGEAFWRQLRGERPVDVTDDDSAVVGATLLSVYLELGDLGRARELADQLISLADAATTPTARGAGYWNAALAAEAEGRIAEALELAERAAASFHLTDDVRNRARLQTALGALHLRSQPPDPVAALGLLTGAEPVLDQFAGVIDVAYCRTEIARAHLALGDARRAAQVARSGIALLEGADGGPIERARAVMVLAAASHALGEDGDAGALAEQAANLLQVIGAYRQAAAAWSELGELSVALGDTATAIRAYRNATQLLGVTTPSMAAAAALRSGSARAADAS